MAAKRRKSRRTTKKKSARRAPVRRARRAAPRRRRRSPSRGAVGKFRTALRSARRRVRSGGGRQSYVGGMKSGFKEAIPLAIISGIITGGRVIGEKVAQKIGLTDRITNESHLRLATIGLTGLLLYTVAHFLMPKYARLVMVSTVTLVGAQFLETLVSEALSKIETLGSPSTGSPTKSTTPAYTPPPAAAPPSGSSGQTDAQKAQAWLDFAKGVSDTIGLTGSPRRSHSRGRGMMGSSNNRDRLAGLLGPSDSISRVVALI